MMTSGLFFFDLDFVAPPVEVEANTPASGDLSLKGLGNGEGTKFGFCGGKITDVFGFGKVLEGGGFFFRGSASFGRVLGGSGIIFFCCTAGLGRAGRGGG